MNRFKSLEFDEKMAGQHDVAAALPDEHSHFARATELFTRGEFEPALRAYSKVLEFNPQNVAAWCGQVRALIELGEFPEAKIWADKALERFSNHPELLAAKAVALARTGDLKAALAFSDASIEERGETPYIWLARGDVLLARKEHRASYCFEKAFLTAPHDWLVRWLAARIQYYYGKFNMALRNVQDGLQLNPGAAALWLQAGNCQIALGLNDVARHSFQQVQELAPGHKGAAVALIRLSDRGLTAYFGSLWRRLFPSS